MTRATWPRLGGTTFHFVTDGIHAALSRAKDAAGGKDVRLGGGAATIRQYLAAGLIEPEDFDAGVRALYRTAEADGVFCYTFFKGVGEKARAG